LPNKNESFHRLSSHSSFKFFVQKDSTWREQIEDIANKGGCFETDTYPGYGTSKAAITPSGAVNRSEF
jgi:hypothetical protein